MRRWNKFTRAIFACATVDFEKFRHGMPLSEINNAVDGGPMYLAPWTIDAIQGVKLKLHQFDLSLCLLQTWFYKIIDNRSSK